MRGEEILRASGVSFRAGRAELVRAANLSLQGGELLAVLGPNGAGKSTLLKLLCGQYRPWAGSVSFEGRNLPSWPARELAQRRAVMPQHSVMPFDFTAEEIVQLGRSPHRDARQRRAMVREAMEWCECAHLAGRVVRTLSGGEMQRVHLARVLVQIDLGRGTGGRILFLDEPVSSLDPSHQHAALLLARKVARAGVAVFVVLHDLNLAAQYADRVVIMKSGRIVADGGVGAVLTPESIGEVFEMRAEIGRNPLSGQAAIFLAPRKG